MDRRNEYLFFVDRHTASGATFPERVHTIVVPTTVAPTKAASASGHRALKDLWAMTRRVMKYDLDLFFFPAVYTYFPIANRTKRIVTIHDLIADRHPELVFPSRKFKLLWKIKQNLAVRQAHLILTVSEYSKRQIVEYFAVPESRVRVIPEAASAAFNARLRGEEVTQTLQRYQLDPRGRFVLYVGGVSPHRNLRALVDAYHRLSTDPMFSDVKLVLVGDYEGDPFSFDSDYDSLRAEIEQLRLGEKVILTGFIEDEALAHLYAAASLLVIPSLEEGFGLPAVEAMTCGTPVISSDRGSLPEIMEDAGRYFDPHRPETMLKLFEDVLSSDALRSEMRRSGLARAEQFTWERSARTFLSILHDVVEG
jgi:glycosyltransferase involved in cell wall biosynthesis